jgi:hypothetical protein
LYESYSGLFGIDRDADRQTSTEDEDDPDPQGYEEAQAEKFSKDWLWYDMISKLCEDDLIKIQQYYELPIKAVLNHLSYKIAKSKTTKN